jgi:starch-binding outer membrane protein, SusD/RagB family
MASTTRRIAVGGAALLLLACGDLDITNTNSPTADELAASAATLARAAIGIQTLALNDVGTAIQFYGIYGREGYNLLGNDPRETVEQIAGPQDAAGRAGGHWLGQFQSIRTINTYLAALPSSSLSPAQQSAASGFAKTMKAWHLYRLAVRSGTTGIPIDVDRPISDPPAPFVNFDEAMVAASDLMDEAYAELQAGGAAFPFDFVPGYAGFDTPATFATFNRGLAAKILVMRATFNGCTTCWAEASTAINASFITTAGLPGSLDLGVYYGYTGAANEAANPMTDPLDSDQFWVHPSIRAGAQTQPGGALDQRFLDKVAAAGRTRTLNSITASDKFILYNDQANPADADTDADIPWLKNEELILLRAEIRWNTGNQLGAIQDIDLVRAQSGGLAPSGLLPGNDAAFVTELLYNRTYSLLWEQGARWIDARRYNRLATLPIDRTGDVVHPQMLVPATECDARGLTVPCDP